MADILPPEPGQPDPVEYAELAVATRSPLLLIGSGMLIPMLSHRMAEIVPVAPGYEHLRASKVPFRAPHYTISPAGLLGRDMREPPGAPHMTGRDELIGRDEFSLAKGGILYLDEIDEFRFPASARELLAIRMQEPNAPLIVASKHTVIPDRVDLTRMEDRWFRFPLKLKVAPISLSDMRDYRAGGDLSSSNPRSSAAIRARIESYDPEAREIAHDLVEEGRIDDAWRILRGEVVARNPRGNMMRSNPEKSPDEAIAEFKRIIKQPGIESLQIAQDLLEEQGLTLAEASHDQGELAPPVGDPESTGGAFYLVGPSGEPEDIFVAWTVSPDGNRFRTDWVIGFDSEAWPFSSDGEVPSLPPAGYPRPYWRDEAIYHAVEYAWFIVKLMHHLGLGHSMPQLQEALRYKGPFWYGRSVDLEPATPPWLVSRFGASDPSTPEHRREITIGGRTISSRRKRRNPAISPRAISMYRGFHQKEPTKIGSFSPQLVIPETTFCVGDAVHVLYRSDKLNPETSEDEGWIDYIHEHDRGVKVYRCDRAAAGEGDEVKVPAWIHKAAEGGLVCLGFCQGFEYKDDAGRTHKAKGKDPLPELYTIKSGKALLVIQSKRTLLALIWGGRLGVEPRGIVH